jgi:hypothetical protein
VRDVVLAIGVHVLYELGRGFVSDPNHSEVRAACRFLAEVRSVEFLPQAGDVIRAELTQAVLGVPIVTVLSPINQFATRLELTQLGCGYGDQAATFSARREASAYVISSRIATANRRTLRTLRSMATFDAFRSRMLPSGPASLSELAALHRVKTTAGALSRIAAHPSEFPTLTTWLYCQWYLGWIAVRERTVPGQAGRSPTPSRIGAV